jgi:hypothetical protein
LRKGKKIGSKNKALSEEIRKKEDGEQWSEV